MKKKATKPQVPHRPAGSDSLKSDCVRMFVTVEALEKRADETSDRFDNLGVRFDRILSRVEELALNTTALNTRHNTQIEMLQKQLSSTEDTSQKSREEILSLPFVIGKQISEEIGKHTVRMESAIKDLTTQNSEQHVEIGTQITSNYKALDTRLGILERWRWMIVGGAVVVGVILSRFAAIIVPYVVSLFPHAHTAAAVITK